MRFYESNQKGDPGFELSPEEVAARFWQSDDGQTWPGSGQRLDRTAAAWIAHSLGGCDIDTMDEALDAIHNAMPI